MAKDTQIADDILGAWTPVQQPDQGQPSTKIADTLMGDWLDERPEAKMGMALQHANNSPDAASRVLRLQMKTGLPQDMIERNLDAVEKQASLAGFDAAAFRKTSPIVADWISQSPNHAISAFDDLTKLSSVERFFRGFAHARQHSALAAQINDFADGRDHTRERAQVLSDLDSALGSAPTGFTSGLGQMLGGLVAPVERGLQESAVGAVAGGTLGAELSAGTLGTTAPLTAAAGTVGGAAFGFAHGMFTQFYAEGRGDAYAAMSAVRDKAGQPLSETAKQVGSIATGLINGALGIAGEGVIAKPLQPLVKQFLVDATVAALAKPTVGSALRRFSSNYAQSVGGMTAINTLQEGADIAVDQITKAASRGDFATVMNDPTERALALDRVVATMSSTFEDMAVVGGAVPGFRALHDLKSARRATEVQAALLDVGKTIADTKMMQRLPEGVADLVHQMADRAETKTLYQPIDAFNEHFVKQGADPREVFRLITGDAAAYDHAKTTGTDLPIPTELWATKIAALEGATTLSKTVRTDPDAMNAKEAEAFFKQHAADAEPAESPLAASSAMVAEKIRQQLVDAKVNPVDAEHQSLVHGEFYGTLGAHTGIDPAVLHEKFGANVVRDMGRLKPGEFGQKNEHNGVPYKDGNVDFTDPRVAEITAHPEWESRFIPEHILERGDEQAMWRAAALAQKHTKVGTSVPMLDKFGTPVRQLHQDSEGDTHLGAYDPIARTIRLFEGANQSTFLHESGHHFLEVMGSLADELVKTDAEHPLVQDYVGILKWLGAKDRASITEAMHEKFARGFEKYLGEGKAPSATLRSAFAKFRSWLITLYTHALKLNVTLSPEIRGIMDRMLAGEDAIKNAEHEANVEAFFLTKEEAGMDDAQFAAYTKSAAEASLGAREDIQSELEREASREHAQWWKDETAKVHEEVSAEVNSRPAYVAQSVLRVGRYPDGSEVQQQAIKLDRADVKRQYEGNKVIQNYLRSMSRKEGGIPLATAADLLGFRSGDEMVQAMHAAPDRKGEIQRIVDRTMQERHPGMQASGEIVDRAREAVYSDKRGQVALQELRAIRRLQREAAPIVKQAVAATKEKGDLKAENLQLTLDAQKEAFKEQIADGKLGDQFAKGIERDNHKQAVAAMDAKIPTLADVRRWATGVVAKRQVNELRPGVYISAARQARAAAIKEFKKKNYSLAGDHIQTEMLNHEMFHQTTAALRESKKAIGYLRGFNKESVRVALGKASGWTWSVLMPGGDIVQVDSEAKAQKLKDEQGATFVRNNDYQAQIDSLLERFELKDVKAEVIANRADLRTFLDSFINSGMAASVDPKLINEAYRKNWKQLTTEELFGLRDVVRNIEHIARYKNRLLEQARRETVEEAVTTAVATVLDNSKGKLPDKHGTDLPQDKILRMFEGFFASHVTLSTHIREMDGFADGGALWDMFVRPANERMTFEAKRKADATKALDKLYKAYSQKELSVDFIKRTLYPELNANLSKSEVLAIAMNWGNDGNRQRITTMFSGNTVGIHKALDTLDKRDWDFVQGHWDLINEFWPEIKAKSQRVSGVAPEKVEAVPVITRHGTYAGGYYPLKYNAELSVKAYGDLLRDNAEKGGFASATTKRGHEEARASNVNEPVRLDLAVAAEHIGQVIHDLAFHEYLIDTKRVLADRRLQTAIKEHWGAQKLLQITNAINDMATGDIPARDQLDRGVNWIRTGATVSTLAFNVVNGIMNSTSIPQGINRVGAKYFASAAGRWMADATQMENTVRWVHEKSEMMALRSQTRFREMHEIVNRVGPHGAMKPLEQAYFWFDNKTQHIVEIPTWLAMYEKAKTEHGADEATAVAMANQAVKDVNGGGQIGDQAAAVRGGPWKKLFTAFAGYFINTTYNRLYESVRGFDKKDAMGWAKMMSDMLVLVTAPVVMTTLINAGLDKQSKQQQNDPFVKRLLLDHLTYLSGTMIGVRELSSALHGFAGYDGPSGARLFSEAAKGVTALERGDGSGIGQEANRVGGILFHYPSGQIEKTVRGIMALSDGSTHNPTAIIAGPPPKH